MKKLWVMLTVIWVVTATATGASPSVGAKSYKAGLAVEAQQLLETYELPGITVAVAHTQYSYSVAAGFANLEIEQLMTSRTPMLAASIGKMFVAATVLRLRSDGFLELDALISKWLGSRDWFHRLPNRDAITIRHLLQHTSGLPDHVHLPAFSEMGFGRAAQRGPEGLIALVLESDPLFSPGNGWSYSDTGYLLLGLIIEEVIGKPYEDIVQELFLIPLKLTQTGPSNQIDIEGIARGYVSSASGFGLPAHTTDEDGLMVWNPRVEWTGGGFYSTSEDLVRWGLAYLSGNLVGQALFAEATRGVEVSEDDPSLSYGLGLTLTKKSNWGPVRGHRGWIPGYVSSLQYYPECGAAIAFQINTDIGIVDSEDPVVQKIEERLAARAFSSGCGLK